MKTNINQDTINHLELEILHLKQIVLHMLLGQPAELEVQDTDKAYKIFVVVNGKRNFGFIIPKVSVFDDSRLVDK